MRITARSDEFEIVIDDAGFVSLARAGETIAEGPLLLPRLVPPFISGSDPSDDEGCGVEPTLIGGELTDEGEIDGWRRVRLTGALPHPLRPGHRFAYEAVLRVGGRPLLIADAVRLRTLDGPVRLTHWEHHLPLGDCRAAAFGPEGETHDGPIFDLVLTSSADAPVLAARQGDCWLRCGTGDLQAYGQGALTLRCDPTDWDLHHFAVHRVSPDWAYSGAIHQSLEPIDLAAGAGLSCSFFIDVRADAPGAEDLRCAPSGPPVREGVADGVVHLHGRVRAGGLAGWLRERIDFFTIPSGRLAGLHYGGYCHLNRRHMEAPVNRAEYAEYVLNEYFRTGDEHWLEGALQFARTHLDVMYLTSPGDEHHGGVRHRGCEAMVNPIRSCRTANLFCSVHRLTGQQAYLDAAIANGDYVLAHAIDAQARQAIACRELAALWKHTGMQRFADAAVEIARRVEGYQQDDGSWHQVYDRDGKPRVGRQYEAGEFREVSAVKPEMASYNIIGLLEMTDVLACGAAERSARRALDWLVGVQSDAGAWAFPRYDSKGLWGHGAFQDAVAMLLGYRRFGDERYLAAARRVCDWAAGLLDEFGYIPTVVGVWPHEKSEASLTYFYGLEANALLGELE